MALGHLRNFMSSSPGPGDLRWCGRRRTSRTPPRDETSINSTRQLAVRWSTRRGLTGLDPEIGWVSELAVPFVEGVSARLDPTVPA
ncbi:hypothetical protein HBB16_07680 [Pseudonocardia sp. MCCB 268]|nr:hypothetical protein [Pseudonocardia cytotoxica]